MTTAAWALARRAPSAAFSRLTRLLDCVLRAAQIYPSQPLGNVRHYRDKQVTSCPARLVCWSADRATPCCARVFLCVSQFGGNYSDINFYFNVSHLPYRRLTASRIVQQHRLTRSSVSAAFDCHVCV